MALTLLQFNLNTLKRNRLEMPRIRLPISTKRVISNTSSGNYSQASESVLPAINEIRTIGNNSLKTIANKNITLI